MPEQQQPINVTVTQKQTQIQDGCCGGTGCGIIFLVLLVIAGLVAVWEAMMGVYGLWWAIGAWTGSILVLGVVLLGGFAWADQKFGWGYTDTPGQPQDTAPRDDLANYGMPFSTATKKPRAPEELPATNAYDQIRRLAELRDEGLLSPEEFESRKRDLLDRM